MCIAPGIRHISNKIWLKRLSSKRIQLSKNSAFLAAGLLLPALCTAQSAPSPQDTAPARRQLHHLPWPWRPATSGGRSSIPPLRGQSAARLLERMQAFQAGQVADATVMPLLMQGL